MVLICWQDFHILYITQLWHVGFQSSL
jgi:hypothetical protein